MTKVKTLTKNPSFFFEGSKNRGAGAGKESANSGDFLCLPSLNLLVEKKVHDGWVRLGILRFILQPLTAKLDHLNRYIRSLGDGFGE